VRIHYNNLHTITSRVSKLLGDCKFGNIERELKKALEGKDTEALESEITDLKGRILVNHDEIEELRNKVRSYDLLQNAIGAPGDVVNKARLFDENIRTDGRVSTSKITKVLVTFTRKMDEALAGMRELFSRGGSYPQPIMSPPTATPHKEKPLAEVKTPQQQRIEKDEVTESLEEVPPVEFKLDPPTGSPFSTPDVRRTRSASVEPSSSRGKGKGVIESDTLMRDTCSEERKAAEEETEKEKEEDYPEEIGDSSEEEGLKPPYPELRPRLRSSGRLSPKIYLSPHAPKRQKKSPTPGEGSSKKTKGK